MCMSPWKLTVEGRPAGALGGKPLMGSATKMPVAISPAPYRASNRGAQVAAGPLPRARRTPKAQAMTMRPVMTTLASWIQPSGPLLSKLVSSRMRSTIYTHFADKETLFADLVLGNVDRVDAFVADITRTVHEAEDVETGLQEVARRYLLRRSPTIVIRSWRMTRTRAPAAQSTAAPPFAACNLPSIPTWCR